jgi:hypothetical protein
MMSEMYISNYGYKGIYNAAKSHGVKHTSAIAAARVLRPVYYLKQSVKVMAKTFASPTMAVQFSRG